MNSECESILSKLILLTEQYKRLNELLENKQNLLKQRALELEMRRLEHDLNMQKTWIALAQIDANSTILLPSKQIERATAVETNIN